MLPREIYATANQLIQQHGDKASEYADDRMQELMESDDAKGAAIWLQIGQAIEELQNSKTSSGALH